MHTNIFDRLNNGASLLTANDRLARFFARRYNDYQHRLHSSWHSADILPISSWILRLWNDLLERGEIAPGQYLTSIQERMLWGQVIKTFPEGEELLELSGAVQLAQNAWHLIQQWALPFKHKSFGDNSDTASFLNWTHAYLKTCQQKNLLNDFDIIKQAIDYYKNHDFDRPIFITGFDEIPPLYRQILIQVSPNKSEPFNYYHQVTENEVGVLALENHQQELESMALWSCLILKNNPQTSIGCVIPNLKECRQSVFNTFAKTFSIENYLTLDFYNYPFNISAGLPLLNYPLIATALMILELGHAEIPISTFLMLVRSPFIAGFKAEQSFRIALDQKLRSKKIFSIKFNELKNIFNSNSTPIFSRLMQRLQEFQSRTPTLAKPSEWAACFAKKLSIFGWPGERTLNTTEYQLLQRWEKLLEEFSALDWIINKISFVTSIAHLKEMAAHINFQAKAATKAPIQILGLLEASGLEFDHLWVMGLHDNAFPSSPKPNPFIPIKLQREFGIPHSSAERELHYAALLLKRLSGSAKQVVFSHPLQEEDRNLRASPLLTPFPKIKLSHLIHETPQSHDKIIKDSALIEKILDESAPPILNQIKLKGGTSLFKHQAQCPFRAFALFRLRAQAFNEPELGLSALERGSILHQVMEHLWRELHEQQSLLNLTEDALQELISQKINLVLIDNYAAPNSRLLLLERQRLKQLVMNWLLLEKTRAPFRVLATEKNNQIHISQFEFSVQVDRIDELQDGRKIIIDYKTGNTSINDWFGERPNEPQLPIYCITEQDEISALVFAQLNAEKIAFKGISDIDIFLPGVKPLIASKNEEIAEDWHKQKIQWTNILENLASQFQQGFAKVDPKEKNKTCQFCDLHALCRINEKTC